MNAYNGILPYGDQLLVNIKGKKYLIVDQFCLLPKCKCTDATLDLVPAGEDAMTADPWCALRLKYAKRDWAVMADSPPPIYPILPGMPPSLPELDPGHPRKAESQQGQYDPSPGMGASHLGPVEFQL